jgi:homocitrate synthase
MCPHATNENSQNEEMVAIDMRGTTGVNGVNSEAPNGTQNLNGNTVKSPANGHVQPQQDRQRHNPYAPRASDFLNNISNFKIIESTLRGASSPISILPSL